MLKSVNGGKMSRTVTNCKSSIKSFSGAKMEDMNDYIKLALLEDLNHFILHIGTNDIAHAGKLRGLQQNVSGQLSGLWPLRFQPLPPPVLADLTKIQKFVDFFNQKTVWKLT